MAWRKSVSSFLARQARRVGALGTGPAFTTKQKAKMALGGEAARRHAREYADMKGTARADCIAAQIANGHQPDDLNDNERAYFYD